MSEVAILGCGPAGLLAALAVHQAGHEPVIYSKKAKSIMPGAIFLHEPIPELTRPTPDDYVEFTKLGTREGYAAKVYGEENAPCSWDLFPEGRHGVWSMGRAYDLLWNVYNKSIVHQHAHAGFLDAVSVRHELVLSTIPATALCETHQHNFESALIRIWTCPADDRSNWIEYNGDPDTPHYRASSLFGTRSIEFGSRAPRDAMKGSKPLVTDCDCRPEIHRLGRFGQWKKGVLVHHAYAEAARLVSAL